MNKWYSQESDKDLADNEIHIWLNYLNVHQARIKHLYPLLTAAEKERSERFKFYKHRKAFIASHSFLHTVLAYYIDTPADEIEFSYADHGKPYISAQQNAQNIQFNLSHSNNLAILAICKQHPVGVDIEYANRKNDWHGLSKRFFTENEQHNFFKLPENTQKDSFFKIWTRKEAHMKVTGQGLHLSPTQFEISIPPEPAKFIANLKSADNNFYKMADIVLPDMFSDYFACLSAGFEYKKISQFIQS